MVVKKTNIYLQIKYAKYAYMFYHIINRIITSI